MRHENGVIV